MSSALAIAGVTAVLQHYLGNVYTPLTPALGGVVSVSAKAPDLIQHDLDKGTAAPVQVNLFLHQVTHNSGWRNQGLPSIGGDGMTRLKNPPLALDLHYLLTAYASEDFQAEGLLGYAVLMLHQSPVLTRADISNAMTTIAKNHPTDKRYSLLGAAGLADQIEMIKITPATLGREEMAWLWTALKADYRPTFPFQVSVVLIDPEFPPTTALPVLSRDIHIEAGPTPLLFELQLAQHQVAPAQGDTVTVIGQSLSGVTLVQLSNPRLGINKTFAPDSVTDALVKFKVPTDPSGLPAGIYTVSLLFTNTLGAVIMSTNTLTMVIAPTVSGTPTLTPTTNPPGTLVGINCAPDVRQSQNVSLTLGAISAPAQIFDTQTSSLTFQFPTLSAGKYLIRLRVDGVDSPVQIDWFAKPPAFMSPFLTV